MQALAPLVFAALIIIIPTLFLLYISLSFYWAYSQPTVTARSLLASPLTFGQHLVRRYLFRP